jgi:hypothetical protein
MSPTSCQTAPPRGAECTGVAGSGQQDLPAPRRSLGVGGRQTAIPFGNKPDIFLPETGLRVATKVGARFDVALRSHERITGSVVGQLQSLAHLGVPSFGWLFRSETCKTGYECISADADVDVTTSVTW